MAVQLTIPFASAEAEQRAAQEAIADRLAALEGAARVLGIEWSEAGGRVMRALGHLCGSRRQIEAGLVGLRWSGTKRELAADPMVDASESRVGAVLNRLEAAGLITRTIRKNWRGQTDGVVITLEIAQVRRIARTAIDGRNAPPSAPASTPPDAPPSAPINAPPSGGIVSRTPLYRLSEIPNTPPPPIAKQAAVVDSVHVQNAAPSVGGGGTAKATPTGGPVTSCSPLSATQDEIAGALAAIGIERAAPVAQEFAHRPEDVLRAVQTFRANRRRFRSAGAVVDFLRSGAWPAEGVQDPDAIAAAAAAASDRRRAQVAATHGDGSGINTPWTPEEAAILANWGIE